MSWDIILFKTKQKIQSIEMIDENQLEPTDFDSAIKFYFDYFIEKKSNIEIEGLNFIISFIKDSNLVTSKLINITGENALFELIILAKEQEWQLYDARKLTMINLENPSENGYKNFQNYLQFLEDEKNIPDFTFDDLGDDKEIQKSRIAEEERKKFIEELLSQIRLEFNAAEIEEFEIADYHMLLDCRPEIERVLIATHEGCQIQILLVLYYSEFHAGKYSNSGFDHYLFGHLKLKNQFPKTYIHKELVGDKLTDLVINRDIDFRQSRNFSNKFRVLSDEPNQLKSLLQYKELDGLCEFPEMELEFNGAECIYRTSRKAISVDEAATLIDLTKTLVRIFK